MWSILLDLDEKYFDGEWILGGDFNSTKNSGERKGRSDYDYNIENNSFADFIVDSKLVDDPCKEKRFSWYSGYGKFMSRLDRFLLAKSVVDRWGVVSQFVGPRDVSNHCAIWILKDNVD